MRFQTQSHTTFDQQSFTIVVRQICVALADFMPRFGLRPLSRHPEGWHMPHLAAAAFVSLALAPLVVGLAGCSTAVAQTVTVDKETVATAVSDQLAKQVGRPLIR
jgi:hypothetical protein